MDRCAEPLTVELKLPQGPLRENSRLLWLRRVALVRKSAPCEVEKGVREMAQVEVMMV